MISNHRGSLEFRTLALCILSELKSVFTDEGGPLICMFIQSSARSLQKSCLLNVNLKVFPPVRILCDSVKCNYTATQK